MCILSVFALLKVVGYYDFECSVHVSDGLPKKIGWRVGGFVSSIQIFLDFGICLTLQSPLE